VVGTLNPAPHPASPQGTFVASVDPLNGCPFKDDPVQTMALHVPSPQLLTVTGTVKVPFPWIGGEMPVTVIVFVLGSSTQLLAPWSRHVCWPKFVIVMPDAVSVNELMFELAVDGGLRFVSVTENDNGTFKTRSPS